MTIIIIIVLFFEQLDKNNRFKKLKINKGKNKYNQC